MKRLYPTYYLVFWMVAGFTSWSNPSISSESLPELKADSARYFFPDNRLVFAKPVFYKPLEALGPDEVHSFGPLTPEERRSIEQEENPPAIGIARAFETPIHLNMALSEAPLVGEITIFGGRLSRVSDDILVWTTKIKSGKANELRIYFSGGYFPRGVMVNLFSENGYAYHQTELTGRVGEHGFFTSTVFADFLILQVVMPIESFNECLHFTIPMLIHVDAGYLENFIFRDCYEDVNCEEAGSFPLINYLKESTAWLSFFMHPNYYICSGSLLNDNRKQDFQPFLLTANHCFNSQSAAVSLEARFNYYTMSCNGTVNEDIFLVNGANLLATDIDTDFTLVLLHQEPGGHRVFLGWNTEIIGDGEILHSVNHPAGMSQKYSRQENKTEPINICSGSLPVNFYYTRTMAGRVSGGSSGGVLVNSECKVAGQLKSICIGTGYNPCIYNTYYLTWGRFEKSFLDNGLQYWLAGGGATVNMSVSASEFNFGHIPAGDTATLFLEISNSGINPFNLNLKADAAGITGIHADEFIVDGYESLYLPAGMDGIITIKFIPYCISTKSAVLSISHNADNLPSPLMISLKGNAIPPAELLVQDKIVHNGQSMCFAALQTIDIAGNGTTFIVENNGVAYFNAGANIFIHQGAHFKPGGYAWLSIVTDGSFCGLPESILSSGDDKPLIINKVNLEEKHQDIDLSLSFSTFPNPTPGIFTLELMEAAAETTVITEIFNILGERVMKSELPAIKKYLFDLSDQQPGIYLIRVMKGDKVGVKKIIRH